MDTKETNIKYLFHLYNIYWNLRPKGKLEITHSKYRSAIINCSYYKIRNNMLNIDSIELILSYSLALLKLRLLVKNILS